MNSKTTDPGKVRTVFVFCFHNFSCWYPYYGFRMNKEYYSAHHFERETILMDGITMLVLKVEEVTVKNVVRRVQQDSDEDDDCLLYTSPSPRDRQKSRMPSSA